MKVTAKAYPIVVSVILMVLWGYLAFMKLWEHADFKAGLEVMPLVPYRAAAFISWLLPGLFMSCLTLLGVPEWRLWGFIASAIMLLFFTIYIWGMVFSVKIVDDLPCTCDGIHEALSWKWQGCINIGLFILAVTAGRHPPAGMGVGRMCRSKKR